VEITSLTPFTIDVSDADVRDLKARIANTRWPWDVADDWTRGVPTSDARRLADRWANDFDWQVEQAALNSFPQLIAEVDGQPIHVVHVRSAVDDATPLLLAHGYPSSFVEFTRMIGPLVDPEPYGGRPEDAFHVVIPSLPGFGFSTPTTSAGWGLQRTAMAYDTIMRALGYERYGISGGDIGAGIADELSIQAGERVIGSLIVTDPGAIATDYGPPTDHLTDEERERHAALKSARAEDFGYLAVQTTRPQSIAYGLTDSPIAQLSWIAEKFREWTDPTKVRLEDAMDIDQLLANVSVYWFGRGGAGAANFLYESMHAAASWGQRHDRPQGFVSFGVDPLVRRILDPDEQRPYWNEHPVGGHFPGFEAPDLWVEDLRAFFRRIR
jgi:pimeloyl-ACP methyl ester carboxylesterase